jgi:hypothetical protein
LKREALRNQPQALDWPRLYHYAMTPLGSTDVPRYLGRLVTLQGEAPKWFRGEVMSDLKHR